MAVGIAFFALCISALTLVVVYRNQVERRHAEIAKLRSDFLMKLSATSHRILSVRMHLETARLEARKMRNSDDKYYTIEKIPQFIEKMEQNLQKLSKAEDKLEQFDTTKAIRGDVLMRFQSAEHEFRLLEQNVGEVEQDVLKILTLIRSQQEEANHLEYLK